MNVLLITGALQGLAVAVWLWPASVHIVGWSGTRAERVAYLPSFSLLLWTSLAALGIAVAAIVVARRRGRGGVERLAASAAPLWLLWLWAVPFVPWIPDRLPLMLVLSGPLRWGVAAAAIGAALGVGGRAAAIGKRLAPRVGRRTVFATSLALYLVLGLLSSRTVGPGGDEPHYLIITQSLLADADLKIENNHVQEDYRSYFGGRLRPDFLRRGQDGDIYSIHAPGLSALLMPVFAVAGYPGAVVFLCLVAALTALAIFDLAHGLAGGRVALITWAAVCLTVPFVPHSWLIFPEMPGALIVAWTVLWLWQAPSARAIVWAWRGVALASLVWLHTKFVVFLAIFCAALLLKLWGRWRPLIALYAPIVASSAAWLYFFYVVYGEINPEAPYGDYTRVYVLAKNIPRGLLGLLVDQKFGLLFYAPAYLFAAAGGWLMLRRADLRFLGAVLLVTTAVFVGSTTRLYMWWGGSSAPARFLVPLLPCLAPMLAVAFDATNRVWARGLLTLTVAVGVGIAAFTLASPEQLLLFSDSRGRARLVELAQAGSPLAMTLPSFTAEDWVTPLADLWPWLAAGLSGLAAMAAMTRKRTVAGPFSTVVVGGIVAVGVAAVATARPVAAVREDTVRRGALDLLWRYDAPRLRPFDYRTLHGIDAGQLLERASLRSATYPLPAVALPPGAYEATVWFAAGTGTERSGEVVVASAQKVVFGRLQGAIANPARIQFELAVPVARVSVSVSGENLARAVTQVTLEPRAVVSVSAREENTIRVMEPIPGASHAYLVYADDLAYPEGGIFWTRGTGPTRVLVAPGGASRLTLTLSLGPMSGDVRLVVGDRTSTVTVPANEPTRVIFDLPPGVRTVPLEVRSPTMFRPSEVDPDSGDRRLLGCQVRVVLE